MSISRAILAALWALYAAVGLVSFVNGGFSFVRVAILLFVVITIVALTGKAGQWATTAALVFSGILVLLGAAIAALGAWGWLSDSSIPAFFVLVGLMFAAVAGWTIYELRHKSGPNRESRLP